MRPGKLPAATHKLMSEPMLGSGLQSPVLVASAMSLYRPTGYLPAGCVSDQRAQEEELDMWMQSIGKTGAQRSSRLIRKHQTIFRCSYLLIVRFLPFFLMVLFHTASLAVGGGGKMVMVHQAHFPNTILTRSPGTEWTVQPWQVKAAPWSCCCCSPLLWPAPPSAPGNEAGGWPLLGPLPCLLTGPCTEAIHRPGMDPSLLPTRQCQGSDCSSIPICHPPSAILQNLSHAKLVTFSIPNILTGQP